MGPGELKVPWRRQRRNIMIIVMKQNAPLTVIEQLEQEMRDRGFQVDRSKGSSKVVLGLVGDTSALEDRKSVV